MSEYLLSLYRPVADTLLVGHGLFVPESTRDNLATSIMYSRLQRADSRAHSPMPALQKARRHALTLLRYVQKPPTRKDSIRKRCTSLHAALLGNALLAIQLGVADANNDASFNLATVLDSLETGHVDTQTLTALINTFDGIKALSSDWRVGRPRGLAKQVVRDGCIVWKCAGRTERYSWREDKGNQGDKDGKGMLSGPLPDFLRDLFACCNGTHVLVAELERALRPNPPKGSKFKWPEAAGDGLSLSDKSMQLAIMDCKNSGLI